MRQPLVCGMTAPSRSGRVIFAGTQARRRLMSLVGRVGVPPIRTWKPRPAVPSPSFRRRLSSACIGSSGGRPASRGMSYAHPRWQMTHLLASPASVVDGFPGIVRKGSSARGVLCGRCEHVNPGGNQTCEHCRAGLFVTCHNCGSTNQAALSLCRECGRTLRNIFRITHGFPNRPHANPVYLVLIVAVLAFLFVVAY